MSTSAREVYRTPRALFRQLDAEFRFRLDAAALPDNALCEQFYTPADDGLSQPWEDPTWCNPPYGPRETGRWVRKAAEDAGRGVTSVLLIPARVDTCWWHDRIAGRAEVRFIRGRLTFEGQATPAPFPAAIVVFGPLARAGTVTHIERPARRKRPGRQRPTVRRSCNGCPRRIPARARSDSAFCSNACRQKAYRTRKAAVRA